MEAGGNGGSAALEAGKQTCLFHSFTSNNFFLHFLITSSIVAFVTCISFSFIALLGKCFRLPPLYHCHFATLSPPFRLSFTVILTPLRFPFTSLSYLSPPFYLHFTSFSPPFHIFHLPFTSILPLYHLPFISSSPPFRLPITSLSPPTPHHVGVI